MNNDSVYTITEIDGGFTIFSNGGPLTINGRARFYTTRSSARKAVSRLRRGVTR